MRGLIAAKRSGNRALLLFGLCLFTAGCAAPGPPPISIRAGLLLDGRGGQLHDVVVEVVGGRIRSVAPYRGVQVTYDLSSLTVLPGLIDAHVHISGHFTRAGHANSPGEETPEDWDAGLAAAALATLRAGFTTVASMGADPEVRLRADIEAGRLPGPRILTSLSPIRDTSLTLRQLTRAVRGRRAHGADFIKIFASGATLAGAPPRFSRPKLTALCHEARRIGLRSVVHAESEASVTEVIAAGCDEVEHGTLMSEAGLRALAAAGIWFDPQCGLLYRNYLDHRSQFEGIGGFDSAVFAFIEAHRDSLPLNLRRALHTPGLRMLYGTDAVAGAHGQNAEDLVCRVREAGESPMEALVTATSRNAEALGLGSRIGSVAPGLAADLIALDGNPLDSIEAVRRVKFVMKGGRVFVKP